MPVLDATFLIDLQRRPTETEPLLRVAMAMGEDLVVPAQVAIEYASGEVDTLVAFQALARDFKIHPCDDAIIPVAARLAREARTRGAFPGWADSQIAATAVLEDMVIITRNPRHFETAFGLAVWDYSRAKEPPKR
jgi:predicted nucleic acid-binding protein